MKKSALVSVMLCVCSLVLGFSVANVFADTLSLPLSLPATINGTTYQHGAIVISTTGNHTKSWWYYNQTSGQQLSGCTMPLKPTVYTPYNRWDIWYTQARWCSENDYNVGYCSNSTNWSTYDNSNSGMGAYAIIDGTNGQAYSDLDWVNTNSGLCYQGTLYHSENWDSAFPTPTPLSFPLDNATPYTAEVSAVMDQTTLGTGAVYDAGKDNTVESFEGEVGNVGPYSNSTCYRKSDNTAFGSSFNYVGTDDAGGAYYLCYDAHPGYDYPKARYTDIHAPADGVLCVAASTTQQPQPADVWRDTAHCPYSTAGSTNWDNYHTFYILHEGLYINGATNDYMTVFLHSDDLESLVREDVADFGHRHITRGEHIAEVGGYGPNGPTHYGFHMHFEVYKKNGEGNWDRVDPYGDGTNSILWEQN